MDRYTIPSDDISCTAERVNFAPMTYAVGTVKRNPTVDIGAREHYTVM